MIADNRGAIFLSATSETKILPVNLTFLRCIDLGNLNAFTEKEELHLIEEKLVRIGVRNVDAEMIDELHLLLLHSFQHSWHISLPMR